MSRTIYVVIGECGEYSDREEWLVEAHYSELTARERVQELEALARCHHGMLRAVAESVIRKHPRGDRKFQTDYTGTRYRYEPVPLEEVST